MRALVLPAVRKLALLAALWTRGARVFVRQSSETPGALELGMRRSSSGLRDGVARAIVTFLVHLLSHSTYKSVVHT